MERLPEVTLSPVGMAVAAFAAGLVLGLYAGYAIGLFDNFVADAPHYPLGDDPLDDALRAYIAKKRNL